VYLRVPAPAARAQDLAVLRGLRRRPRRRAAPAARPRRLRRAAARPRGALGGRTARGQPAAGGRDDLDPRAARAGRPLVAADDAAAVALAIRAWLAAARRSGIVARDCDGPRPARRRRRVGVHPLRRTMAFLGRRLGRPELLAAVYAPARQAQLEEVGIAAVLAAALGRDGTYVDVGTNRGQVLREAVRVAPNGRHIAFEPIAALAAEVRRSFPQVDCRGLAIGARREQAEFCHFRKLDGWSGLRRSREISDERGDPEFITVQVSTLDEGLD